MKEAFPSKISIEDDELTFRLSQTDCASSNFENANDDIASEPDPNRSNSSFLKSKISFQAPITIDGSFFAIIVGGTEPQQIPVAPPTQTLDPFNMNNTATNAFAVNSVTNNMPSPKVSSFKPLNDASYYKTFQSAAVTEQQSHHNPSNKFGVNSNGWPISPAPLAPIDDWRAKKGITLGRQVVLEQSELQSSQASRLNMQPKLIVNNTLKPVPPPVTKKARK